MKIRWNASVHKSKMDLLTNTTKHAIVGNYTALGNFDSLMLLWSFESMNNIKIYGLYVF